MKPTTFALAMHSVGGLSFPRSMLHPSIYAQGQNALFAIQGGLTRAQFQSMSELAKSRYIQETDEVYRLFPVSTRVYGETADYVQTQIFANLETVS